MVSQVQTVVLILIWPMFIYMSLNLIWYVIGIQSVNVDDIFIGEALLLKQFGFTTERVRFIFASGINSYGALIGIVLTVSMIGIFLGKSRRPIFLLCLVLSIITLLLTDTRAGILFAIISFVFVSIVFKKGLTHLGYLIPAGSIFGPILLIAVLVWLSDSGIATYLSRSNDDISTGNSRAIIWGLALSEFSEFKALEHLFGYGEYGHYESGVSSLWASIFNRWDNADLIHPHNAIISVLLDYGYLGVLVYIALFFRMTRNVIFMYRSSTIAASMLMGTLTYLILIGITESIFGMYYQNAFYLTLIVACLTEYKLDT
jgi:O-antigen ligase